MSLYLLCRSYHYSLNKKAGYCALGDYEHCYAPFWSKAKKIFAASNILSLCSSSGSMYCNISISLHIEISFLAKSVSTLCKEIEGGRKKIFLLLKLVSPLIIEFPIEVIFSYLPPVLENLFNVIFLHFVCKVNRRTMSVSIHSRCFYEFNLVLISQEEIN